jgi:Zn-dependent protease
MIGNTGFAFGWAKPTPVNPSQLEGGRYGEAIVAIAGPISNLVLAIAAALPLRYILANPGLQEQIPFLVLQILFFFILINLVLMVFNLFPIPPLDGSKVLFAFLPPQVAWRWRPILEQYGFILLLIVFFLPPGGSIGGRILVPIIDGFLDLLVGR